VTTFVLSAAGVWIGSAFGARWRERAQQAGGLILILMGAKILIEHLGLLTL
jgi:putative Mn2+ efflux pump MntP